MGLAAPALLRGARAAEPLKVGYIYLGPIGDYGWTWAHEKGRKAMVDALKGQVVADYVENESDPMVGKHLGGVIVFGGGLALYEKTGVVGAVGVSGDSACADHNIAWRIRKALGLGSVPAGVNPNKDDGIIYDIAAGASKSGWGHPTCGGKEPDVAKEIGSGVGP